MGTNNEESEVAFLKRRIRKEILLQWESRWYQYVVGGEGEMEGTRGGQRWEGEGQG